MHKRSGVRASRIPSEARRKELAYKNAARPFHLREPMAGEPACYAHWRELAAVCEDHLRLAGIRALQREGGHA